MESNVELIQLESQAAGTLYLLKGGLSLCHDVLDHRPSLQQRIPTIWHEYCSPEFGQCRSFVKLDTEPCKNCVWIF